MSMFNEKIAICFTVCGKTYVNSAIDKLNNVYIDDPNLHYFVITDDKSLFADVHRENFIVRDMEDIYAEHPEIAKYETLLSSHLNLEDYKAQVDAGYVFPFSIMRFHVELAMKMGITNVALMATDSILKLQHLQPSSEHYIPQIFDSKNKLYNEVSLWYDDISTNTQLNVAARHIKELFNLEPTEDRILIFDEAARMYVFEDTQFMERFFEIWHKTIVSIYESGEMYKYYIGWVIMHDEFILALIYHLIGITCWEYIRYPIIQVNHQPRIERPWRTH